MATAIVRMTIGAVSLGSDELVRRWRRIQNNPAPDSAPAARGSQRGPLGPGDLMAGVAIESAEVLGRLISTAGRAGGRATAGAGRMPNLPVLGRALSSLSERGRHEEVQGRRMVERLIRDTTSSSVADIAQFAVNEVTHSPEVAALVRSQSAGIATDAILEVRANSEQADDRLERRVQSWLHLRRPNGSARRGAAAGDPGHNRGA
jgi:hypothetical protein